MSLESLFQHILSSEHRAQEGRRLMREGPGHRAGHWAGPGASVLSLGGWGREEAPGAAARAAPILPPPPQQRPEQLEGSLPREGRAGPLRALRWAQEAGAERAACLTVRSEISRCRDNTRKAAEELNEEKIKLESKVLAWSAGPLISWKGV